MLYFKLEIEMGNEAMQGNRDIAQALRNVAYLVEESDPLCAEIRDRNGNTVGEFHYKYKADKEGGR